MKKILLTASIVVSSILFVGAQSSVLNDILNGGSSSNTSGIKGILKLIQGLLNQLVPILIGMAVLAFFWFIVQFIWMAKDNPDAQIKARAGMGYSILAIFVMVSIWGIIALIGSTLGIAQGGTMPGFKVPGQR